MAEKLEHVNLRPHVVEASDLYDKLRRDQAGDGTAIGIKAFIAGGLVAAAAFGPESFRPWAIFLSFGATISVIHTMIERSNRNWFMHYVTLHRLIAGREE